jgi:acyl-CoA synthetase (AMP-forming)/AMP-acid ligase II
VVAGTRTSSAGDLADRQAVVRRELERLGVRPRQRVAIAVGDAVTFMTSVAAVRDLGAVATLISSRAAGATRDAPQLRAALGDALVHAAVLDDAHAKAFADVAPAAAVRVAASGQVAATGELRDAGPPTPDDAALLLYTSGTEGRPKGVLISEGTLAGLLAVNRRVNAWTPGDVALLGLPLTHLAGLLNFAGATSCEATCVIGPEWMWTAQVMDVCLAQRVTVLPMVPYQLSLLLGQQRLRELASLRLAVLSTAPIVPAHVRDLLERLPGVAVVNAYGLTEAFRSTVLPASEVPARLPSIGRPVEGVEIELREGVAWIRGPNVMMGYWNQPAETARVLRDGWFCTRDLMRRDGDGFLYLEGRLSELINGGGEKLSPEIVEALIVERCPAAEVAVLGVDSGRGYDEVIAVAAGTITLDDVRAACARRVHSVFVPTRLVTMPRLPRNATGKLDRAALRRELEAPR